MTPLTPAGQATADIRNVRMSRDLWDQPGMSLRTWSGREISIEWGEPDGDGFYSPTFRMSGTTEAERTRQAADRALAELRRVVEYMPRRRMVGPVHNRHLEYDGTGELLDRAEVLALIDKASKPEEGA